MLLPQEVIDELYEDEITQRLEDILIESQKTEISYMKLKIFRVYEKLKKSTQKAHNNYFDGMDKTDKLIILDEIINDCGPEDYYDKISEASFGLEDKYDVCIDLDEPGTISKFGRWLNVTMEIPIDWSTERKLDNYIWEIEPNGDAYMLMKMISHVREEED